MAGKSPIFNWKYIFIHGWTLPNSHLSFRGSNFTYMNGWFFDKLVGKYTRSAQNIIFHQPRFPEIRWCPFLSYNLRQYMDPNGSKKNYMSRFTIHTTLPGAFISNESPETSEWICRDSTDQSAAWPGYAPIPKNLKWRNVQTTKMRKKTGS